MAGNSGIERVVSSSSYRATETTKVTMKLTALMMMLVAALAMFVGAGHAAPGPKISMEALKETLKKTENVVVSILPTTITVCERNGYTRTIFYIQSYMDS